MSREESSAGADAPNLTHLNAVLKSIRNINQLVVREKDPSRIASDVCRLLTDDRGLNAVWIALFDDAGRPVHFFQDRFDAEKFSVFECSYREGTIPRCVKTISENGFSICRHPETECPDCALRHLYGRNSAIGCGLSYEGRFYGVLCASLPGSVNFDSEEESLFCEVANDIAFALHAIRINSERQEHEARYRELFDSMINGFALHEIIVDADGKPCDYRFLGVNPAFEKMTGLKGAEIVGRRVLDVLPATEPYWIETYGRVALCGETVHFENFSAELDRHYEVVAYSPQNGQFVTIVTDVTDRVRAVREKEKLEEQLRQSQKMESIGRLAGGVAHDFNNLLMVIEGHCELMARRLKVPDPLFHHVEQVRQCTERGASLTRQLLAFSRKQALQPVVLDLNSLLLDMEPMLLRLIGEHIEFEFRPSPVSGNIKADPGQIEQVIMNLVVNARDAMPNGGRLTIETRNVMLDERYASEHTEVVPGPHVVIAVSDNGEGMDAETRKRIFEPFFTTKGKGRGTGLGLSTVYGIIRQSGGHVWVYSELGKGTTFKIYLPIIQESIVEVSKEPRREAERSTSQELILVVEDEPTLRELFQTLLEEDLGYRVQTAANAGEAILAVEEEGLRPDLVITDVVMPGMSGKVLAERLRQTIPDLVVLFMSGYTDNAIVHHGVLDPGTPFLQKPFSVRELSEKIISLRTK